MYSRRKLSLTLAHATLATLAMGQLSQADPISWRHSLDAAKIEASQSGKLVLLHFYTPSCGPCKKLERDVFSQPQIAAAMQKNFIPVKLNADHSPALANAYQITRVPFEVVLNAQGNVVQKLNCPLDPNSYETQLNNVAMYYSSRSDNRTASANAPVNSAYAGLRIGQAAKQKSNPQQTAAEPPQVTTNPYYQSAPPTTAHLIASQAAQTKPATLAPPSAAPPSASSDNNPSGIRYAQVTPTASRVAQVEPTHTITQQATSPQASQAQSAPSLPMPITPTEHPKTLEVAASATKPNPAVTAVATKPKTKSPKSTETVAEKKAWPPTLPAGTPELAFEGYCPVSLREASKWVRGSAEFGAIHRGRTYLFASDAQRQKFLASPFASDSYSPVFSGNDPVKLLDENEQVAGSRKHGFTYQNAFYLFSSKETMERFARQPEQYSLRVGQAMARIDGSTGGTIRR